MPNWTVLLHPDAHAAIDAYRLDLVAGRQQPGDRLARVLAANAGAYDPQRHAYQPPAPYRTWGQLVADRGLALRADGRITVLP